MKLVAFACLAAGVLQGAHAATEYYADPVGGNDANDGRSAATAFRTLERAAKGLKAGDVLNLAPGAVFHESLVITSSGTATAPILVRGNGATVSGVHPIDPGKWEPKGDDLWFQPSDRCWGALRPRVFIGDEMISPVCGHPNKVNPADLSPRTAIWQTTGVYFRAEKGKTPRDYALTGGVGRTRDEHSGVIIEDQSYITIERLVAERFPNDGFNVHGVCSGIVCTDIVARYNGDDGFSIHEDIVATVVGLHSHHNDFGIQDAGYAQTIVSGAVLEHNRLGGFDEHGGIRILRDAVIRSNGCRQISIRSRPGKGKLGRSPLAGTMAYFENVKVEGGDGEALLTDDGVTVTARNCTFSGTQKGLELRGGRVHLEDCAFGGFKEVSSISPKCVFTQIGCTGLQSVGACNGSSDMVKLRQ